MRAAEVAPKFKNYSRTSSLDYRINIVVGIHNMGSEAFYRLVFNELGIDFDNAIEMWFAQQDSLKRKKKIRDETPKNKRRRKHRWMAKEREELYLERTRDVKMWTYGSGIGIADGEEEGKTVGKDSARKERAYCTCSDSTKHKNRNSQYCMFNQKTLYKHLMSLT